MKETRWIRLVTPMRVIAGLNGWTDGHLFESCDGCGQPDAVISGLAVGAVHTQRLCENCFEVEQLVETRLEEAGR